MDFVDLLGSISEGIDGIASQLDFGIQYLTLKLFGLWFDIKLATLEFFWGISSLVLNGIGYKGAITSLLSSMPQEFADGMRYFKIFEFLEIIASSAITRYIMGRF